MNKLLSIRQAAAILGVNPETLRRWDREGKFIAVRFGIRKDRKYKTEDILHFIETGKVKIS